MSDPTIPTRQKVHGVPTWTSTWSDPRQPGQKRGRGHCKRFGRCDQVSRTEAMKLFQRWLDKEYLALRQAGEARYTVDQLCHEFYAQMGKRYVVDGKHTTSIVRIRIAIDSLRSMYGADEADSMTSGKIAVWLESHIHERLPIRKGGKVGTGPKTKETVNLSLSYVKRMFRWGAKYGKVSDQAAGSVQLVENLRADHADVRKKERVRMVKWSAVSKTLAVEEGKRIADPVMVLWHTGMRPGEMLSMRPCDIEFSGDGTGNSIPIYTPRRNKNTWRGQDRKIALGPKAWAIIKPLLPTRTDALVFTKPCNGRAWRGSQFCGVLQRAAKAAKVEPFTPNQIRHSCATRIAEEFGAEGVQAVLGHDELQTQKFYVEKSLAKAIEIARRVG